MLAYEEIQQAFEKAIKNVGIKAFKTTSLFSRNNKKFIAKNESEAA